MLDLSKAVICSNDDELRCAIANKTRLIGIKIVDNASNAVLGSLLAGKIGAALFLKKNTTPGMQTIIQENGNYNYKQTEFLLSHGNVMFYEINEDSLTSDEHIPQIIDMTDWYNN